MEEKKCFIFTLKTVTLYRNFVVTPHPHVVATLRIGCTARHCDFPDQLVVDVNFYAGTFDFGLEVIPGTRAYWIANSGAAFWARTGYVHTSTPKKISPGLRHSPVEESKNIYIFIFDVSQESNFKHQRTLPLGNCLFFIGILYMIGNSDFISLSEVSIKIWKRKWKTDFMAFTADL